LPDGFLLLWTSLDISEHEGTVCDPAPLLRVPTCLPQKLLSGCLCMQQVSCYRCQEVEGPLHAAKCKRNDALTAEFTVHCAEGLRLSGVTPGADRIKPVDKSPHECFIRKDDRKHLPSPRCCIRPAEPEGTIDPSLIRCILCTTSPTTHILLMIHLMLASND
jgi:hypothetical protein